MRLIQQSLALAASVIALAGCGRLQAPPKQQAQVSLRVADAAMSSGAPDLALHVADAVLEKTPGDPAALRMRGDALYAMGRPDDARAAYRRAVALAPSDAAAQTGLGRTLVRTDPRAAEAAFLAALATNPDDLTALNNLGIARDLQGRHEDAQAAYRQALAAAPDSGDVQANLDLSLALAAQAARPAPLAAVPPPLALRPAPVAAVRQEKLPARTEAARPQAAPAAALAEATATVPDPVPDARAPADRAPADRADAGPPPAAGAGLPDGSGQAPPEHAEAAVVSEAVEAALALGPRAEAGAPALPGPAPAQAAREVASAADSAVPRPPGRWPPAGYYVQLGALNSDRAAQAEWHRLSGRMPALFAGRAPVVQQADIKQRTYWRLRTGTFADAGGANDFCARLRAAGADCWRVPAGRD